MNDTKYAVSSIPSFAGLADDKLDAIARSSSRRSYEKGETVFHEGDEVTALFYVIEGWLKASKISVAGREQVVRFVRSGESFNEIGAFSGGVNRATVYALESTDLLVVPRERILSLMNAHPRIARVITENLAKRVVHLMSLVEDLAFRTVSERFIRMLLQHSSGDTLSRRAWSTQSEMAARLGTVPDVLNRAIRGLVEEGLLEINRRTVRILDRAALQEKLLNSEERFISTEIHRKPT